LNLVDEKEVFLIDDISIKNRSFNDTTYFDLKLHSYDELLNLTLQSGIYSRFNIDANFKNGEYQKLYTEWINKSIKKEMAIDIIVKIIKNKIVGFTTYNRKSKFIADIGLVAVDPQYRGQGIARELIERTIYDAYKSDFKQIQ